MKPDFEPFWPAEYTYYAIAAAIGLLLVMGAFFGTLLMPPLWLIANLVVLAVYFITVTNVSSRALKNPGDYSWKLFRMAWIARLLFGMTIILLAEFETGRSFYVGAVDAVKYQNVSSQLADIISSGNFNQIHPLLVSMYFEHTDNYGVPLLLGFTYAMFGSSIYVGKVLYTLIGSGTVVLIYKTTRLIWGEATARLAGILFAFFPLALFYSSVLLKEEVVVFLSMLAIFIMVKSTVLTRIRIRDLILLIFVITSIFLFRTAAGALLVALVAGTFVLNRLKGSLIVSLSTAVVILGGFFWFLDVFGEVEYYVERVTNAADFAEARIRDVARGNALATIMGTPVFVALSFIAPFPSMVYLPLGNLSHDATYYWISGLMIWNFLAFFGLWGLWKAFWEKRSESLPVWGFAAGYSFILGFTALFTTVRFGYNAMPAFFILISAGIAYRKEFPYWKIYMLGALLLIFAWNLFRLAGRGML